MKKIGLVIDEGADLPKALVQKYNIKLVPIKLDWPEVKSLPGENIYQKMREAEKRDIKSFGKTSQPSPKDFLVAYRNQFSEFENIICITLTSKLSGTYNSAIQAKSFLKKEQQEKLFIVDSLNVSGGEALLALKALNLIDAGNLSARKIAETIKDLPKKINLRVIFRDPKWVEASGRISSTVANWIRKMQRLKVRPVLGFKNGFLKTVGVVTGAKDVPTALLKELKKKTKDIKEKEGKISLIINHGDDIKGAEILKKMIENEIKTAKVEHITLVNDIIGAIAGPDAIALSWTQS